MRAVVESLEESRIREVANAGMGLPDVLKFWFGESDEVTPDFIREAAIASLNAGETFYAHNLGLPELRHAIAGYTHGLHPQLPTDHWFDRIAVTSGGVNGLMLASQTLVEAGDEVVVVTPAWPNLVAQPQIMGACVRTVPLTVAPTGAWVLDLDALLAAVTPATRMLIVNAPNNPTGWTLRRDEQAVILAHCRRTGTWILADEVYERLYFAGDTANGAAPSFLDVAEPEDRLIVAHSFSKSFLMTGWRLGWLVLPTALTHPVGKLIEMPGVQLAEPRGGMYAFFRLEGQADCLLTAKRLVREAGLGLAPGSAFGPEAAGWLRWCFASRDPQRLAQGAERLRRWLAHPG